MHKRLFAIITLFISISVLAFSQGESQVPAEQVDTIKLDSVVLKGVHPWKEDGPVEPQKAYWSLYLHGGFNVFDGDFTSEKKHGVYAPSVGLGGMYHFNNTWGIGADYIFRLYRVTGKDNASTAPIMLKGMAHQADAFITFDIFNAWRPQNRFKLFALNLLVGGGVSWYKNSTFYPNEYHTEMDGVTITLPQRFNYHTAQQTTMSDDKYTCRSLFMAGATFEFNVTRGLAIGFRGVYNYYTKDDIDGRVRGNNNDGVFDATLMLRYKIQATKKSHVANFRSEQVLARKVYELNPDHGRGAATGNSTYGDYPATNAIAAANGEALKDTVVIVHRDTILAVDGTSRSTQSMSYDEKIFYIYFDPNEHTLYDSGLKVIQQVADRLSQDENLYIEITGFCDNTGTSEYNLNLGKRRAHSVAEEFIMEYGIDSTRIKEIGRGIIRGRRSTAAYSPNRRAVIKLMSKDEFEQSHGKRPAANQLISGSKKVVIEKNSTLAKLAREYYGNTHCWIYIFENNLSILPTPSNLQPGTEITLPVLTEKQMLITKEEAAQRFEKYKIK